jgi:transposase
MMGRESDFQHKLFITGFDLDKRVRKDHILRKIAEKIDFNFIYKEVEHSYGLNGHVSVPPPVILKMMLLLVLYNVRSERELVATIPERLDWLWFLRYDLDDDIPDHSVLSKARARWGMEAFKVFFERIVWHCVEEGLVDGRKLFSDSSLIDAHASNNSVVDTHKLRKYLNRSYRTLEKRLDDIRVTKQTPADSRYISTTDPDASVTRQSSGKSKLRYKIHRAVDGKHEVITATKVTPGCVDDGHVLEEMIGLHEKNTEKKVETAVGDSKYGTMENFLLLHDLGVKGHIPSIEETHRGSGRRKGIFSKEAFSYDPHTDTFLCPAGQRLRKRNYSKRRKQFEYKASVKTCSACHLKDKCTRAKGGRTLRRHARQDDLDKMIEEAKSRNSKEDLRERQHLSERSFAESTRYGFKRARWRGQWRMEIQDFLIAAIQNIVILIRQSEKRRMSKSNIKAGIAGYCQKKRYSSFIQRLCRRMSGIRGVHNSLQGALHLEYYLLDQFLRTRPSETL